MSDRYCECREECARSLPGNPAKKVQDANAFLTPPKARTARTQAPQTQSEPNTVLWSTAHRFLEAREADGGPGLRGPQRRLRRHEVNQQEQVPRGQAVRRRPRLRERHQLLPAQPDGVQRPACSARRLGGLEGPRDPRPYRRVHPHRLDAARQHAAAAAGGLGELDDAPQRGVRAPQEAAEVVPGRSKENFLNLIFFMCVLCSGRGMRWPGDT